MMHSAHNDVPSKRLSIKKFPTESYLVELNLRVKRGPFSVASTIPIMGRRYFVRRFMI